jgi:hypothetical protein
MGGLENGVPNTASPQMQIRQVGKGTSDELHVSPSGNSSTEFRRKFPAICQQRFRRP